MTKVRKLEYANVAYNCRILSQLEEKDMPCQYSPTPNCGNCAFRDRGLALLNEKDKMVKMYAELSKPQSWEDDGQEEDPERGLAKSIETRAEMNSWKEPEEMMDDE